MPHIEASFDIDQPLERVWDFFQDVPELVTCMPGLELTGRTGAAGYQGRVKVRLGPIIAAFEGEATIVDVDARAHLARIEAAGVDRRGGNRASADVAYEIGAGAAGTHVRLYGDIKLSGALAQMGRSGIIQDVANELTVQFADNLRVKLASPVGDIGAAPAAGAESASISGARLALGILWSRVKRALASIFGRGG